MQYIDATKRGGIARFINHSCEPNCYVAKWVVGRRMRMGIFAKRDIVRGEELTFNYNVDRYGSVILLLLFSLINICMATWMPHRYDAQVCHCGEPSCLGTIGGKTQTDIRILDPLYIEGKHCFYNSCGVLLTWNLHYQLWARTMMPQPISKVRKSERHGQSRISIWSVQ